VVPRLEGRSPEGNEVVDYHLDPATVVVIGPENAVRNVRRATTGSLPVGGLTASRGVREKAAERVLRDVPVRVRGGATGVRLGTESMNVRISGLASLVGSLDRGNLVVEVEQEKP